MMNELEVNDYIVAAREALNDEYPDFGSMIKNKKFCNIL